MLSAGHKTLLFDRQYRLLVGKKGSSTGIEITELRIKFDIEKSAKKNPNNSTIEIYNLTKSTRAELEKPNTRCVLYAGYKDQDGPVLIFQGDVTFAWTAFELPDVITKFELGDGSAAIRDTTISVGYGKGVNSKQILHDVSKKMDTPLVMPSNLIDRVWQNGLSFFGPARTLLDKVTKGSNTEWSIQNGNLQVIETGMVTTRQGIIISAESGLIKSPERERAAKDQKSGKTKPASHSAESELEDESEEGDTPSKKIKSTSEPAKGVDGWRVNTLLMPSLNPGDRVQLDSRSVQGIFRIQELKHKGDNWEGDWQTEMKLIDTAAPLDGGKGKKGKSHGGKAARGDAIGPHKMVTADIFTRKA